MKLVAASGLVSCGTGCGPSRSRQNNHQTTAQWEGSAYNDALRSASENWQQDRLTALLTDLTTSKLAGSPLGDVSQFSVGPNGNIYILDDSAGTVLAFTAAGRFISKVGQKGLAPGRYTVATDVVALPNGCVAVSDFKQSRVHVFDSNLVFSHSILTAKQRFSSSALMFAKSEDIYYLVGSRYFGEQSNYRVLKVHAFRADGAFFRSTLPFPTLSTDLKDMERHTSMALEKCAATAPLIAFPFEYQLYELQDGEARPLSGLSKPEDFKSPSIALGQVQGPNAMNVYRNWTLSWTPINYVGRCGDQILVQRQVFAPLRYMIDVYSNRSRKLQFQVGTNHRLLTHDDQGALYFLTDPSVGSKKEFEVMRARWKGSNG